MAKKNGYSRARHYTTSTGPANPTEQQIITKFNANTHGLANPGQNPPNLRLTYDMRKVSEDTEVSGNHKFSSGYRIKFDGDSQKLTVFNGQRLKCTRETTTTTTTGDTVTTKVVVRKQSLNGEVQEDETLTVAFNEKTEANLTPKSESGSGSESDKETIRIERQTFTEAQKDLGAQKQLKPVLEIWDEARREASRIQAKAAMDKVAEVDPLAGYRLLDLLKVFPDEDLPFSDFVKKLEVGSEPYNHMKERYASSRERIMFRDELAKTHAKLAKELAINKRLAGRPYNSQYSVAHVPTFAKTSNKALCSVTQENAQKGLVKLLAGPPELLDKVMSYLPNFRDHASLGQTCRHGLTAMQAARCHWDASQRVCDTAGVGSLGSSILTVSRTQSQGYRFGKHEKFGEEIHNHCSILNSLSVVGHKLRVLHLQQLNLLTPSLVGHIVAAMPALKHLGVHQCLQLGYFQTAEVLRAVKDGQDKRRNNKLAPVEFDFAPMYFAGPNSCVRVGSYGVFFNEPCFSTDMPIVAKLVYDIWPAAQAIGMNPLRKGTSFRHFMDRLPISPGMITKVYAALAWREKEKLILGLACPDLSAQTKTKRLDDVHRKFDDLITAAIRGDGAEPATVPKATFVPIVNRNPQDTFFQHQVPDELQRLWLWWRKARNCMHCDRKLSAWAFFFGANVCGICMATEHCDDHEDHHYKGFYKKLGDRLANAVSDHGTLDGDGDGDGDGDHSLVPVYGPIPSQDAAKNKLDWGWMAMERVYLFDRKNDFHPKAAVEFQAATGIRHPQEFVITHRLRLLHQYSGPIDRKLNDVQYMHPSHFPDAIPLDPNETVAFSFGPKGKQRYGVKHQDEKSQRLVDWGLLSGMYQQANVANRSPNAPYYTTDADWRRQYALGVLLPGLRKEVDELISRRKDDMAMRTRADWAIAETDFYAKLVRARQKGEDDEAFLARINQDAERAVASGRKSSHSQTTAVQPLKQKQTALTRLIGLEDCPYPLPEGMEWVWLREPNWHFQHEHVVRSGSGSGSGW